MLNKMMWSLAVLLLVSIPLCTPESICENLLPFHGNIPAMTTASPFTIKTSASTVKGNEILTIQIISISPELRVNGFIMHARSTSPPFKILGRFVSSIDGLNSINCDGENNTVTFDVRTGSEGVVELQWQAPNDYLGEVMFKATIVEQYDQFWAGIESTPVKIVLSVNIFPPNTIFSTLPKADLVEGYKAAVSTEQRNTQLIYDECGTTKTCLGLPNNCVEQRTCVAIVTGAVVQGNRYEFELQSGAANVGYVSIGLSTNGLMGDDVVMECIPEGGIVRAYSSWNFRRSNTRHDVPQNVISLLNSSFVDGTIYCKLEREALTVVLGQEFDLVNQDFYFSLAIGSTVTASAIGMHNLGRIASTQPLQIGDRQTYDPIYVGCGTTKTCLGLPNNCIEPRTCVSIVTGAVVEGNRYEFELQSGAANIGYVSIGLSRNGLMGDDVVMECIPEGGIVRAYSSWNFRRSNTRQDVPQDVTSLLNASFVDGTIYCKLQRETVTSVLGHEFDLANEDFYFSLAVGSTVTASAIGMHNLGRIASTQPLQIGDRQPYDPIYEGCGTTKTCYGLPSACVEQRSCPTIVTAAVGAGNRYEFEMKTSVANAAYVSMAFSRDLIMGDDSVMECIPQGGIIQAYTSWNTPRPNLGTTRQGVPQNIISLLNSSFVSGTIYCRLERDVFSTVLGHEFDLENEDFYFQIAIGTTVTAASVGFHNLGRISSTQPLQIGERQPYDPIYEGCGTTKSCVGLPADCVEQRACRALVTAFAYDNQFQFELKSSVPNVGYVALGLSRDNLMGNDSVLECIPEGGSISAHSSWNNRRDNTRQAVPQNIFRMVNSSYIGGTIYCKLERDRLVTKLDKEFDLGSEDFYFLVAIGETVTASSIGVHNLGRISSSAPIVIVERDSEDNDDDDDGGDSDSANFTTKISVISVAVWFLATSFSNYLRGL